MLLDPEYKQPVLKKLHALAQEAVDGLVVGKFADIAAVERQRGLIVGIGMCIDAIEDKPAVQLRAGEDNEQAAA